jgi:predicted nuclease of predicted toxin-antitoxin system
MLAFLVDEHLPSELVTWLLQSGHRATHVRTVRLGNTDDKVIIAYARLNELIVVTKDGDFLLHHARDPLAFRVVVLKFGNCSNRELLSLVAAAWPTVRAGLEAGDRQLLIER